MKRKKKGMRKVRAHGCMDKDGKEKRENNKRDRN